MTTVAIVGCTHAGTFAAQSILQAHPDWTVHVYERNDTLSFLSCGIALWVGDHVSDPQRMFYSSPEALGKLGARMHMRHDVLNVDVKGRTLLAKDLETDEQTTLAFDKLVVTTGSKPVIPPIPGLAEGLEDGRVKLCKNWGHGLAIKEMARNAKSVAVIGAGYIGAELAEQFSEIGVKTVLIDGLDRVLAKNFDKPISDVVEQAFTDHGVTLALGHMVTEFRLGADGNGVTVMTSEGEFTVDCAIMGAGFLPRTNLFDGQLDMLPNGAITTDEYMRATISGESEPSQDVFAAGDSATVFYNPTGTYDYIPLATNAVRQALLVGANIVEPTQKYMGTQATSAVQLYDLSMAATGLTQGGAEARGVTTRSTTLTQDFRPDFMLTTTPVTCTLTWDPETRVIKGAQFLSRQADVAQAANAVSIAIQAGFTIDQLANVDLLFQPNFSQPVNYIAAVAMQAIAES
ncbi:pyridine nucleotide-disulfide oxidoreductase [Bifidobacterium sp. UTCIF-39]|uniref:FAD-dependent oxidoreductase n=1 Tax=Bifidobacterium sp. UTCIF-39 TaxID=1465359 RepID=UPI001127E509|nr:FAD-dependent oxidoreductase [Bifidobacterium sp. UTCIF-39]TPF96288.1 pyridine nucleotide-disulfide oxidoreductase [Bifidobacterium sp. UTCIF-39]